MIKYKSPTIKIIDHTSNTIGYDVWKLSKNSVVKESDGGVTIGDEFINEKDYYTSIMKMNMQYNNIPYYVLEIEGSLLFRDILYNINKTSQWATSLRLTHSVIDKSDINNYVVSSEYEGIKEWEDAFYSYYNSVKDIEDTDKGRVTMPYSLQSKYWIGINFKSLVNLLNMMRLRMPFFYNIYGKLLEIEINNLLPHNFRIQELYSNELDSGMNKYFNSDPDNTESSTRIGDYYYIKQSMSLILYSQFIRQADTDITGLWSELVHSDKDVDQFKHQVFTGDTLLHITYMAHKDRVHKTVKNRVCWFSQSNGDSNDPHYWSKFLETFLRNISIDEFKELLPCKFSNGKLIDCKYKEDVKFRDKGLQKGYIPCAILNKNLEYADLRCGDCNNKLNNLYKKVTEELISGGVLYTYKLSAWTSELIIKSSINLEGNPQFIQYLYSSLDLIRDSYSKFSVDPNLRAEIPKYSRYGIDGDNTCFLKGLLIDYVRLFLDSINVESYLISFGGDVFSKNVHGTINIEGTNFYIDLDPIMSVFTSGNTTKRGNHIIGGNPDEFSTVIVRWNNIKEVDNALVDALATKYFAKEKSPIFCHFTEELGITPNYLDFNTKGELLNRVYCASPFFNDNQIAIRDKMVSRFTNAFRPDLTDNSMKYNNDHSNNELVYNVVEDNINGIDGSDYLVFPNLTPDLGTLFEVGHAIAIGTPIIRYLESDDKYIIEFIEPNNNIDPNKNYLFDCSKKTDAIAIGYVSQFTDPSKIFYSLNGQPDNIMISIHYKHIELVDGKYKLIERSLDDRDQ